MNSPENTTAIAFFAAEEQRETEGKNEWETLKSKYPGQEFCNKECQFCEHEEPGDLRFLVFLSKNGPSHLIGPMDFSDAQTNMKLYIQADGEEALFTEHASHYSRNPVTKEGWYIMQWTNVNAY